MLRLNASFSKKVPGEQPYSSEGLGLSIEVELPDQTLADPQQFTEAVRRLFGQARAEVERQSAPSQAAAEGAHAGAVAGRAPVSALTQGRSNPAPPSIRVAPPTAAQIVRPPNGAPTANGHGLPASKKQLDFLISLAQRNAGMGPQDVLREAGVRNFAEIRREQASALIERFGNAGAPR